MFKFLMRILENLGSQPINSVPVSNRSTSVFENAEIQLQDDTGNWRTFHVTQNNPPLILTGMNQLSNQFPGKRVRAVSNGRIVDIL